MTEELKAFARNLDSSLFRYAHITGALEFYMMTLENPKLQQAVSRIVSGSDTEWRQIHRFMVVNGQPVTWYPELPVQAVLGEKNALLGFLYGITLSRVIGDLDFYLTSVLQNHFDHVEKSGNSWDAFKQKTKIDLQTCKHGEFVYVLIQERHKIEHNQAQVDRVFLERTAKHNIKHVYNEGDSIQKSHVDVLLAHEVVKEFAEDIDTEVGKLIGK